MLRVLRDAGARSAQLGRFGRRPPHLRSDAPDVNRSRPNLIELFADVTCPFTHVGLKRLVERRRELMREDVNLWVRAWPLELVNGAALEPETVAHKIQELRAQVAPELFAGFDRERFPATSIPALLLTAHAYEQGLDVGERTSLTLREALFEEGRDISADEVLQDIARRVGATPVESPDLDRVTVDWHEGEDRHVIGSPHFFVDGTSWFCPALDISQVDGRLRIVSNVAGFNRFARACFGR
jgi:2-hydroxychromene-2-carboxylate isomerase